MFTSWFQAVVTLSGGAAAVMCYLLWRYPWLRKDFQQIKTFGKVGKKYATYKTSRHFIVDLLTQHARKHPKKPMIIFQDNIYTFEYMEKQVNKAARAFLSLGLKKGDIVALLIHNEPPFIWTYLGLVKIGVEVAFLNFNLRSKSLLHCLLVSDAKTLVVGQGEDLVKAVEDIYSELDKMTVYVQGNNNYLPCDFQPWDVMFQEASDEPVSKELRRGIRYEDPCCYIYTSGTTGLPKAARVTHAKCIKGSTLMSMVGVNSDDVIYTGLPLYHSAAGIIALGTAIEQGATLVLRNKFSATYFWEDCIKHNVTVIQYIGELCRYLLARPKSSQDCAHKVRCAFGNGLRLDIWKEFQERFNIPIIGEFYAATEGNAGFINLDNKFGSVGRMSPLFALVYPCHFIKYDIVNDEPVRGTNGLCIPADIDEPGLMVCKVKKNFEFDGYKGSRELNQKKIVKDVFKKGDMFFNSGDLLVRDKDYHVYFNDRIGDTFRWKGENVSTTEVSNVVSDISWVEDASVYGVAIPGQDGRAGMAAVTTVLGQSAEDISASQLGEIYSHCSDLLPGYAMPRFLRIMKEMKVTVTLKQRKVELVQQGFDPVKCSPDPLFCLDITKKQYIPVDKYVQQSIVEGSIRL